MDLKKLVREVLEKGYLMSLGICDSGGVWVSDVIYVHNDNFEIFWISHILILCRTYAFYLYKDRYLSTCLAKLKSWPTFVKPLAPNFLDFSGFFNRSSIFSASTSALFGSTI